MITGWMDASARFVEQVSDKREGKEGGEGGGGEIRLWMDECESARC